MAEIISVNIIQVTSRQDPPSTTLEFVVKNEGNVLIWLVNDRWLIWQFCGKWIELSFHRGKMRSGAQVFGYFSPEMIMIKPGDSVIQTVELNWPQPLDSLWNREAKASPHPGLYQVSVRVGYGLSANPEPPSLGEAVEAGVLRWQKVAISPPVSMEVPVYRV